MSRSTPLVHSRAPREGRSGLLVAVGPREARWQYVRFAAHRIVAGDRWVGRTGGNETCLVLLSGLASIRWSPGGSRAVRLGPRGNMFVDYPHAVYLPPKTSFEVQAEQTTEMADCRSPTRKRYPAREIRPEDCGFEVRGGGNATRQIIDILPPSAEADRLLICEVLTPSGNWSSYPPHKHDRHRPPIEADLEETYYYRFNEPAAYGIQRLYTADGRSDQTLTVTNGDLVMIRSGYHPFVAAYGYDAYYLNTLAGSARSMAATDDPRYAHLRSTWPPPDPRVPLIPHPASVGVAKQTEGSGSLN
jgi:5-deoxy-glucuronate isomerase